MLQGAYVFPDLADGTWTIKVEMRGFAPVEREVQSPGTAEWNLAILPLATDNRSGRECGGARGRVSERCRSSIRRRLRLPAATNTTSGFQRTEISASNAPVAAAEVSADVSRRAADGFLVNGSVNNAASSPFTQLPAFGNNRAPGKWRYNGNLGFMMDNSLLDARPFSLTGQNTPRLSYNRFTGLATLGGPIRIPGLLRNGPQFTLNYQWTRNRNAASQSALVPTAAERAGDFSQTLTPQGSARAGDRSRDRHAGSRQSNPREPHQPAGAERCSAFIHCRISTGRPAITSRCPIVSSLHQDSLQLRGVQQLGRKDNLSGTLQLQSSRTDNPNLFGFLATGRQLTERVHRQLASQLQFALLREPRIPVQPQLRAQRAVLFASASMSPAPRGSRATIRTRSTGVRLRSTSPTASRRWAKPSIRLRATRRRGFGGSLPGARPATTSPAGFDFHRQQWNILSQQDPRGTFTFTGAAAGSDLAGFLFGVPDTASIAFGNADKYFRANSWDAYVSDDWRFRSGFSLTLGVRYEYNSPIDGALWPAGKSGGGEQLRFGHSDRCANPRARSSSPTGTTLRRVFGFAWRPFPASTMVVRGGYGIYYDNPIYQSIATQMAQQAPLSTSLRVENSAANPLTLANGFRGSPNILATTFAIDPRFRAGYAQNWQLSVQRDLHFALQVVATYLGIKGTRAVQQFLPNTFPAGAVNPCAACPSGFTYMTSNGNSIRHAGTLQLRRRLRQGFTAEVQYTWAKSARRRRAWAARGFLIAQNWLDLRAERARSNFDQRHMVVFQAQYTTGAGSGGFLTGRTGAVVPRMDCRHTDQFRYRPAADPYVLLTRARYRRHRQHTRQLHGRRSL